MGNQQLSSEQEKAQRLGLPRAVPAKSIMGGEVDETLTGNAEGQDIVCASWKHEEVHKRTASEVTLRCELQTPNRMAA
jgi:hypothetical protein